MLKKTSLLNKTVINTPIHDMFSVQRYMIHAIMKRYMVPNLNVSISGVNGIRSTSALLT